MTTIRQLALLDREVTDAPQRMVADERHTPTRRYNRSGVVAHGHRSFVGAAPAAAKLNLHRQSTGSRSSSTSSSTSSTSSSSRFAAAAASGAGAGARFASGAGNGARPGSSPSAGFGAGIRATGAGEHDLSQGYGGVAVAVHREAQIQFGASGKRGGAGGGPHGDGVSAVAVELGAFLTGVKVKGFVFGNEAETPATQSLRASIYDRECAAEAAPKAAGRCHRALQHTIQIEGRRGHGKEEAKDSERDL